MWNLIKAQHYQLRNDKVIRWIWILFLGSQVWTYWAKVQDVSLGEMTGSYSCVGDAFELVIILSLFVVSVTARVMGRDYKDKTISEYRSFQDSVNKEFASHISKTWKEYSVFVGEEPEKEPKPKNIPVAEPNSAPENDVEIEIEEIVEPVEIIEEEVLEEITEDVFEEDEIDRIYLNFSDPWPKNAHAKRRLTSGRFLPIYERILNSNGEIHFKTDNRILFEFSLESLNNYGLILSNISLDLHNSDYPDNIVTEYEEKFSKFGPIYRLEAKFK